MRAMEMKARDPEGQQEEAAAAVRVVQHSQVRRIKEEDEKVKVHETYQHKVSESMRLVLRDLTRQRSRSPLGRAGRPAISIGGDS